MLAKKRERTIKPGGSGWPLDGPGAGRAPAIGPPTNPLSFYFIHDKSHSSPSHRALWEMTTLSTKAPSFRNLTLRWLWARDFGIKNFSFNLSNLRRWLVSFTLGQNDKTGNPKKLSDLLEITQLVRGRAWAT